MNPSFSAWLLVAASVVAEVVGTVALKYSDGFSKVLPSGAAATCYALAIWLMAVAMRHLDMGITYAVWAGSGTAATALVGVALFGEQLGAVKALGLVCVVGGVVMLNVGSPR
ncbi:DMT family transporter [Pseudaquabacterium pictum]|jgi:small multidrug resistance pump|uniref:QacE family quaternary ammonium compound efflux SMR transporter n=1 Tax=Pseudaquabacterium pictum TaxID=2315236 RepID=A0A480AR79_9BURK|nr:multidrug efflux SMR transporter [Rubrivivax pictus]GCL62807.1 QacE family quaternary ammonium compound efflux SMR transporter [Rubrivivax pictus]